MRIARVVGQVVKVEKPTMTSTRRRYARVYVEIDLSKGSPPESERRWCSPVCGVRRATPDLF